jgi:Ser/Thr protein kinase RdoA (MazF antagonist)
MIDAYRQFRDFDERWLCLAEPLRAMRFVHYAAWIARRWQDPAFPPTFPHFGTHEYWENETRDLEEQGERIEREDESGSPTAAGADAPELSNEDFFWDL